VPVFQLINQQGKSMYDEFSKPELTGSLIFRDTKADAKVPPGKKLMLVFGVVAVDENFAVAGETQVRVRAQGGEGIVHMQLKTPGEPVDPKYLGWRADDILEQPLWSV
jgi:hypothetical protein